MLQEFTNQAGGKLPAVLLSSSNVWAEAPAFPLAMHRLFEVVFKPWNRAYLLISRDEASADQSSFCSARARDLGNLQPLAGL